MRGRSLSIAGLVAALALLVGGTAWWVFRGAAGDDPEPVAIRGEPDTTPPHVAAVGRPLDVDRPRAPTLGGARVQGTVFREGQPAVARLRVYGTEDPQRAEAVATGTSGADGAYALLGLPKGGWDLIADDDDAHQAVETFYVGRDGERVTVEIHLRVARETLRGRVVGRDGSPWRGQVLVSESARAPVATGGDGGFTLEGLPPGDVSLTGWDAQGTTWGWRRIELPRVSPVLIDLQAGTMERRGLVVDDATSTPIPGATLTARGRGGAGLETVSTTDRTDRDGRFAIRMPKGTTEVEASTVGYARTSWILRDDGAKNVIRLVRPGLVRGRVTSEATRVPVAGAEVTISPREDVSRPGKTRATTATDGQGRFRFASVDPGHYVLSAHAAGHRAEKVSSGSDPDPGNSGFAIAPTEEVSRDLVLKRVGRIEGRVVDPHGRGIPGAWVRGPTYPEDGCTTQDDGTFVMESVWPGKHEGFDVQGVPGLTWYRNEPERIAVHAGSTARIILHCGPETGGLTLKVRIADPQGRPIDRAYVAWGRDGDFAHTTPDGLAETRMWDRPESRLLRVYASKNGWISSTREIQLPEATRRTTPVLIQLSPAFAMSGRVLDGDGRPVPDVQVGAYQIESPNASTTTDVDGTFRLWVEGPGSWSLRAAPAAGAGRLLPPPLVVQAPATGIELRYAAPELRELLLHVVDPDGNPVPSVDVFREGSYRGDSFLTHEGTLRIGPAEGPMTLQIYSARDAAGRPFGCGAVRVTVRDDAPSEPVEVRLPRESVIQGRVVDAAGHGIPGLDITASPVVPPAPPVEEIPFPPGKPPHASTVTADDGRFRLEGLWAGAYELELERGWRYCPIDAVKTHAPQEQLDIVLRRTVTAVVTVVDADDEPVGEAHLKLADVEAKPHVGATEVESDGAGLATFMGLDPDARSTLRVWPPRGLKTALPATLKAWRPENTRVRLARALVVRGRVVDAEGRPYSEFAPTDSAREFEFERMTTDPGSFELGNIPSGLHTIEFRGPDMRGDLKTLPARFEVAPERTRIHLVWPGAPIRIRMLGMARQRRGLPVRIGLLEGGRVATWAEFTVSEPTVECPGFDPGRDHVVLLGPDAEGRVALLGPVRPRSLPYETALEAPPDRVVRIRAPGGAEVVDVVATSYAALLGHEGGILQMEERNESPTWPGRIDDAGQFTIRGVPEGQVWVRVRWRTPHGFHEVHALHTGPLLDISLPDR